MRKAKQEHGLFPLYLSPVAREAMELYYNDLMTNDAQISQFIAYVSDEYDWDSVTGAMDKKNRLVIV